MIERDVENRLRIRLKAAVPNARCVKFVSPGFAGVPDRIILLPRGRVVFAELKAPGKRERKLQLYVQDQLRRLGFPVFSSVRSAEDVENVVEYCRKEVRQHETV